MPTEGEAVGPIVIKRRECCECDWNGWYGSDFCVHHGSAGTVERVYWPANEVLEELKESSRYFAGDHVNAGVVVGDIRSRLRRFSGEGAS